MPLYSFGKQNVHLLLVPTSPANFIFLTVGLFPLRLRPSWSPQLCIGTGGLCIASCLKADIFSWWTEVLAPSCVAKICWALNSKMYCHWKERTKYSAELFRLETSACWRSTLWYPWISWKIIWSLRQNPKQKKDSSGGAHVEKPRPCIA